MNHNDEEFELKSLTLSSPDVGDAAEIEFYEGDDGGDSPFDLDDAVEVADEDHDKIGLFSACNMIIGMMVGSGIFASPGEIMRLTQSPGASLLIWLVGGCLAFCGSLCYAELGTIIEDAGAEQAYLGHIYGSFFSFEFSWFAVFIGRPCGIAIILFVCADYLVRAFHPAFSSLDQNTASWTLKGIAIFFTVLITSINAFSSKGGLVLQNVSTVLKMLALIILSLGGTFNFLTGRSDFMAAGITWGKPSSGLGNYVLALFHSLWAYDGWNNLNFITPELKTPGKTLPRSISIAVPTVVILYLFTNISYYINLSIAEMSSTGIVDIVGRKIFGSVGGTFISLCVAISTFGSANACIYTGGRLAQASAEQSFLPYSKFLKIENKEFRTPVRALIFQCIISIIFILSGQYNTLITLFSWMVWIFYALTVSGVIILRYRSPERDWNRIYKVPLILTIPFLLGCVILIIVPIFETPFSVLGGLLVALLAVPGYYVLIKKIQVSSYFRLS
jgi:amino acid transporter